jgi:hypothetical protein
MTTTRKHPRASCVDVGIALDVNLNVNAIFDSDAVGLSILDIERVDPSSSMTTLWVVLTLRFTSTTRSRSTILGALRA